MRYAFCCSRWRFCRSRFLKSFPFVGIRERRRCDIFVVKLLLNNQRSVGTTSNGNRAFPFKMSLLQSFNLFKCGFYKYAAPTALPLCVATVLAVTLAGCSETNDTDDGNNFPIRSKMFSHVE